MATNGNSARQWLKQNHNKVTEQRIRQIRDNLEQKISTISHAENDDMDDDAYQGLVEALEVMEAFILENYPPAENSAELGPELDFSPLASDMGQDIPCLDSETKRNRFQALLKDSKF